MVKTSSAKKKDTKKKSCCRLRPGRLATQLIKILEVNFHLLFRKDKMRGLDGGKMDGDLPFMIMINFITKRFSYTIQAGRKKNLLNILMNTFLNGLKMKNRMSLIAIVNFIEKNIPTSFNLVLISRGNNKLKTVKEDKKEDNKRNQR